MLNDGSPTPLVLWLQCSYVASHAKLYVLWDTKKVFGFVVESLWFAVSFRVVLSCLVLSCLVLSCLVLSCLVLSCLVLSCLVLMSCLFFDQLGKEY